MLCVYFPSDGLHIVCEEFGYDGVFSAWEVIWAATHCSSQYFRIFLALALVQEYK